ncbi:MAG: DinB family protein [Bacteroidota bacterium]|nr:DinB family protein [Bacteroidota bacterium]
MKQLLILFLVGCISSSLWAQKDKAPTVKSILLEQLKTTHNVQDWFVPPVLAVQGLTAEQANWKDSSENHSIAQLTTHLIFWDKQSLDKFKGNKTDAFDGNNKETFSPVTEATWAATTKELDNVLTQWEEAVQAASEQKLEKWYSTIAHIGTHNAYHTGQILYIRKMKGWWDDNKGVK